MSHRPGFTLIEVIVASFMATLVLGAIVFMVTRFGRQAEVPIASMSMEQTTMHLLRWLQRDLAETNTQSVVSIPGETGLSMESARDFNDRLTFGPYGVVRWQKHLHYWVQERADAAQVRLPESLDLGDRVVSKPNLSVGELIYDETYLDQGYGAGGPDSRDPIPLYTLDRVPETNYSPLPPFHYSVKRHRVMSRNILIDKSPSQPRMGCAVFWRDASGNPQPFNPGSPSNPAAPQCGEPINVVLTMLDVSGRTGQPTVRKLELQVKPKN